MAELDLALLGPPAVTRDGGPVSFDTRKATAVLALLAVHDHELSRERLAALLWPEADARPGPGLAAPHAVGDRRRGRAGPAGHAERRWPWTQAGSGWT